MKKFRSKSPEREKSSPQEVNELMEAITNYYWEVTKNGGRLSNEITDAMKKEAVKRNMPYKKYIKYELKSDEEDMKTLHVDSNVDISHLEDL